MTHAISWHQDSNYTTIRSELMVICAPIIEADEKAKDVGCAAMLLDVLAQWTNTRLRWLAEGKTPKHGLWVYMSSNQFYQKLMGLFGKTKIKHHLNALVNAGLIQRRNNPDNPKDNTPQYLLNRDEIQSQIDNLPREFDYNFERKSKQQIHKERIQNDDYVSHEGHIEIERGSGQFHTGGRMKSNGGSYEIEPTIPKNTNNHQDKVLSFLEIEATDLDAAVYDKSFDADASGEEIIICDGIEPAINLDEHELLKCPEDADEQSYRQVMRERVTSNPDAPMLIAALKDKKLICSNPAHQDIYQSAILKAIDKYSNEIKPMYDAIEKVFGASNGLNGNIQILLTGSSKSKKKTEWLKHSLLFPADVEEVLAYGKWYSRENPDMSPILTPEKLASSFEQFRLAQSKPEQRRQKIMTAADAPKPVELTPEEKQAIINMMKDSA